MVYFIREIVDGKDGTISIYPSSTPRAEFEVKALATIDVRGGAQLRYRVEAAVDGDLDEGWAFCKRFEHLRSGPRHDIFRPDEELLELIARLNTPPRDATASGT